MKAGFFTALFLACVLFVSSPAEAKQMHEEFTAILSRYVKGGVVDYKGLRSDPRFSHYLAMLAVSDPDSFPSDKDRLAFWINAYNAYTLKMICDNYPIKSINDLSFGGLYLGMLLRATAWDRPFVIVNGRTLTLNEVEHKIIRKLFKEPRIHFALVCAAKSCPSLRSEAYEGDTLDRQLDDQAIRFLSDRSKNSFDLKTRTADLSSIFSWFGRDFGKGRKELLIFLSRYLPQDIAQSIRSDPGAWKIRYLPYDWALNE